MADNPYVNKVEYGGQTLMDLTGDTVTPSDVLDGVSFHDRSGAAQQGSLITHSVYDGLDSSSTSDALSANQGRVLDGKILAIKYVDVTGQTDNGGNIQRNVFYDGFLHAVPIRDDSDYYTSFYMCTHAANTDLTRSIIHCMKGDGTALASQSVKVRIYYLE